MLKKSICIISYKYLILTQDSQGICREGVIQKNLLLIYVVGMQIQYMFVAQL